MGRYLTFYLENTMFGINVLCVLEINNKNAYTFVPGTVSYVKGLLNLRGEVVTILDLRKRLKFPDRENNGEMNNIILKIESELSLLKDNERPEIFPGDDRAGLLVDKVVDIVEIDERHIDSPPSVDREKYNIDFISGVCQLDDQLLMFLDLEKSIVIEEAR